MAEGNGSGNGSKVPWGLIALGVGLAVIIPAGFIIGPAVVQTLREKRRAADLEKAHHEYDGLR